MVLGLDDDDEGRQGNRTQGHRPFIAATDNGSKVSQTVLARASQPCMAPQAMFGYSRACHWHQTQGEASVVRMGHRVWGDGRCPIRADNGVGYSRCSHRHPPDIPPVVRAEAAQSPRSPPLAPHAVLRYSWRSHRQQHFPLPMVRVGYRPSRLMPHPLDRAWKLLNGSRHLIGHHRLLRLCFTI